MKVYFTSVFIDMRLMEMMVSGSWAESDCFSRVYYVKLAPKVEPSKDINGPFGLRGREGRRGSRVNLA